MATKVLGVQGRGGFEILIGRAAQGDGLAIKTHGLGLVVSPCGNLDHIIIPRCVDCRCNGGIFAWHMKSPERTATAAIQGAVTIRVNARLTQAISSVVDVFAVELNSRVAAEDTITEFRKA